MKIFYSWQSDTPYNIGKVFIREALDLAVSKISESMDFSEADRPSIDQDTQEVMGSPVIAGTIYEKIRNANIIVSDVTLIGSSKNGKKLINSNVGIELGFTHGVHGDEVVLAVMNTYYGKPADLPFDLRHRRWPVLFEVSPEADKSERQKIKQTLAKELGKILEQYFKHKPVLEAAKHDPLPFKANKALYSDEGEILVDTEDIQLSYNSYEPLVYLRLWPDTPLADIKGVELNELISKGLLFPLSDRALYTFNRRNRYGVISCGARDTEYMTSSTQIFKNREIWGIDAWLLSKKECPENYNFDYIATTSLEKGITTSLERYLRIAEYLNYPNLVHGSIGMVNIDNFKLTLPPGSWDKFSEPIFEDISVSFTIERSNPDSIQKVLKNIFEEVYDAAGLQRPLNN